MGTEVVGDYMCAMFNECTLVLGATHFADEDEDEDVTYEASSADTSKVTAVPTKTGIKITGLASTWVSDDDGSHTPVAVTVTATDGDMTSKKKTIMVTVAGAPVAAASQIVTIRSERAGAVMVGALAEFFSDVDTADGSLMEIMNSEKTDAMSVAAVDVTGDNLTVTAGGAIGQATITVRMKEPDRDSGQQVTEDTDGIGQWAEYSFIVQAQ